jgi:predicted transcriptional regulator
LDKLLAKRRGASVIVDKKDDQPPARLAAKAANAEPSISVVVSFDARWLRPISAGRISLVLRKRVPQSALPEWMYIYVNSPASVLLGRARIKKILTVSLAEALKRQKELELTSDEIGAYLRGSATVGAYQLRRTEIADNPLRLNWLQQNMTFNPPQSFFFLASTAQAVIDKHAGLMRPVRASSRGK